MKSDLIVHQFTCNSNNNCQLQASTTLLEAVSPQQSGGYVKQTLPHTKYIIYMVETTDTSSMVKVITSNTTDWGLKILSLKASGENKDFMHIITAIIKVALDCHVTDLLDIVINVNMQFPETEGISLLL